jgi:hypothetical protein
VEGEDVEQPRLWVRFVTGRTPRLAFELVEDFNLVVA